jgi:hypothetical protein
MNKLHWRSAVSSGAHRQLMRGRTTPGRLRALSLIIAAGSGLLSLAGSASVIEAWRMVDGVGNHVVPAVIGAEKIHAWLADADRSAADTYLLDDPQSASARVQYVGDIGLAVAELERHAEQNSAGPDASENAWEINTELTQYTGLVDTARANKRQGFSAGVASQLQASDLMHYRGFGILAKTDRLSELDSEQLSAREGTMLLAEAAVAAFFGILVTLLWLLTFTQLFLRRRFRRAYNVRLLAATALLLVLAGSVGLQAATTYGRLEVAEREAFPRLQMLYQARSVLDDINGSESLALIAPGDAGRFDATFRARTSRLADTPLTDEIVEDAARGQVRFSGLLGSEIDRATFPGERAAAVRALRAYQRYLEIEAAVRTRIRADRQGAVALPLGVGPDQLGSAFTEMDDALGQAIDIDQAQFDSAIREADPGLALAAAIPACSVAIALLVMWGLQPRIAEYLL